MINFSKENSTYILLFT